MPRLHRIVLFILWAVMLCLFAPPLSAQNFRLQMWSDPGDWVGGGHTYDFRSSTGTFGAQAYRYGGVQASYLQLSYIEPNYTHWFYLNFGTNQLGIPLRPGFYRNAQRAPFAEAGHPGLDVYGDGRGSNTVTGAFRILECQIDESGVTPQVIRFSAYFIQHSEGFGPALRGLIQYNSNAAPPSDTVPPITTLSRTGNRITLNAYGPDNAEDVANTSYQIDGGYVRSYEQPFYVYGPAGSTHTVTYWSEDFAGNRETPQNLTLTLTDEGLTTSFQIWSSPGDYIGGGQNFVVNQNLGRFVASLNGVPGQPFGVHIGYDEITSDGWGGDWWDLDLVAKRGGILAPGYYGNATRYPFQADYSPGLDFSGSGRGSNVLSGAFWIHEIECDFTGAVPRLVKLAASFAQHSEGFLPPLFGVVRYNSNAVIPDALPPYTMAQLLYTNFSGWYRQGLVIPLTAGSFRNRSSIAATYYQINNEPIQRYSNSALTFNRDGIFNLKFWSVDADGRVETPANVMPVRIDGTPPELGLRAKAVSHTDTTATLQIAGYASDKVSGLGSTYVFGDIVQVNNGYVGYFFAPLVADGSFSATVNVPYVNNSREAIKFILTTNISDKAGNYSYARTSTGFAP